MKANIINPTSSTPIFSDSYKQIDLYNQFNQNNKSGVVFTSANIARDMIKMLHPKMNETIFEPAVGSGVFLLALIEFIVEEYDPTTKQLKYYLENKVYFADIDKNSVDFTSKIIKDFMLEHYQIAMLSLNVKTQDSLLNTTHYDIIIGNPPYIRTKNLDKKYLTFLRNNFNSCISGNIDIYSYLSTQLPTKSQFP